MQVSWKINDIDRDINSNNNDAGDVIFSQLDNGHGGEHRAAGYVAISTIMATQGNFFE